MPADVRHLPVTTAPADGEALDGYLERVAAHNGYSNPALLRVLTRGDYAAALLTIAPDPDVLQRLATLVDHPSEPLDQLTLAGVPGIPTYDDGSPGRKAWRQMASAGWAPGRGTAVCPDCLASDGIWRIVWRHPWVTACLDHRRWLIGTCPTCGQRFRSQRTPLRTVDADPQCCGNPGGSRAHGCRQPLPDMVAQKVRRHVLVSQRRIDEAIHGSPVAVVGEALEPSSYLTELKALTVLLLHLAVQPAGDQLAEWADLARADHQRSAGTRGARWALAPPADLVLRGRALAAGDAILRQPSLDAAADALHPWTALAPATKDGQLGWLADHTTMAPLLSRMIMAATASRRRLATLLAATPGQLSPPAIPQLIPADLHTRHTAAMLDVTDRTGRLFVSLCLTRQHLGTTTWAEAATLLGLPPDLGTKTARACSADLLASPREFTAALARVASDLDPAANHRDREHAVRRLACRRGWYRPWARTHLPGSHATSRSYAVTWLWTNYAHGHVDISPGWQQPPDHLHRAHYRAYARRLGPAATEALTALVAT